jgi:hypothetical protein
MNDAVAPSPNARVWRELYKAALFEVDKSKMLQRIAEAKRALVLRARELFQAVEDNPEEGQALDDAMYALRALGRRLVASDATASP